MGGVPAAPFERKPAPLPARIIAGAWMQCVVAPIVWGTERLGVTEKMLGGFNVRREQEFAKKNPFRGYTPGPQDVFVMTYAKSGTNWMMQIAWQLIHHGKGEYDHIHSVVPWPDAPLTAPMMGDYAIPLELATAWQTAPERKRVIKTHFNWELLPYSDQAKYIAVVRDPKDVFVSAYHFLHGGLGSAMPSVDTMYRLFVTGKFFLGGSWPANAAGYWGQRDRGNVLVMSYKAMKRDLEGTVRQVAAFLDIKVPDDVIREVCAKSSFEYMKPIDHKFATFQSVPWRNRAQMIRTGKQGGSGEMLSAEQQRAIDEHCIAELKRLGSDLPYEEFADLAR
jgi:hypothetical protein